ncbi:M48 family metalloprotease, partial [Candidatus Omnitrophota bacterium]
AGMDDIIPISKDKERRMGDAISKQVDEQFDGVDDPLVQKRVEEIGKRLAQVCERKDFIYRFKVLKPKDGEDEEKYINAFCLPGGYVYIFEPFVKKLKTDDAIAAVAAHEIGHISARHVVKRLQGSIGLNALMLLAVVVKPSKETMAKTNEAIGQLMTTYSREDEFEADRLAVEYMKKAGFDPDGVVVSLKALKSWRKGAREMKYMHFKSHPYLSERISAARSEVKGYTDFDSYINVPKQQDGFY